MRMPLDQMVRYWKGKETNDEEKEKQKHYQDLTAKDRVFAVGYFVLVFKPDKQDKLQNQWQCSFPITKKVTDVTYKIDLGTTKDIEFSM